MPVLIPTNEVLESYIGDYPEQQIMRYFRFDHLPETLREVSRHFADLALLIAQTLPQSAERTVALRKLLEGKDAAVRASLP